MERPVDVKLCSQMVEDTGEKPVGQPVADAAGALMMAAPVSEALSSAIAVE